MSKVFLIRLSTPRKFPTRLSAHQGTSLVCLNRGMIARSQIFAHRGLHSNGVAANSLKAMQAALELGFSIETDIRDALGKVVIEHDPPGCLSENLLPISQMLAIPRSSAQILALNVKSDGLLPLLANDALGGHFFFDMSLPESIKYKASSAEIALRVSEFEPYTQSKVSSDAPWVWLDCFESDWFLGSNLVESIEQKSVIVVSPELHGREPKDVWDWVISQNNAGHHVGICTDFPLEFLELAKVE